MNITNNEYKKLYEKISPKSPKLKDFLWAFLVGGFICMLGQLLLELYLYLELSEKIAKTLVPVTLIFIAALLTATHLFERIAKRARNRTREQKQTICTE